MTSNQQEPKCERCQQLELELSICKAALAQAIIENKHTHTALVDMDAECGKLLEWIKHNTRELRRLSQGV